MYYLALMGLLLITPIFYLKYAKKWDNKKIQNHLLPKNQGLKKELIGSIALFGALIFGFIVISIGINTIDYYIQINGINNFKLNDLEKVGTVVSENLKAGPIYLVILFTMLFIEEFFFRAFLQQRIGILLSTIIFTLAHIGYDSIGQIIGVFFLGLILAYWFKRNKSIIQNYLGHLLYDLVTIGIYFMFG